MKTLTEEQLKGVKFEIFLDHLLNALEFRNVTRNNYFHHAPDVFRQADLCYNYLNQNGKICNGIIEAKYSSGWKIPYKFQNPIERRIVSGKITLTNLIEQVVERQRFIGAQKTVLITNQHFEDKTKSEGKNYGLIFVEREELARLILKLHPEDKTVNLDYYIKNTSVSKNDLRENRFYNWCRTN